MVFILLFAFLCSVNAQFLDEHFEIVQTFDLNSVGQVQYIGANQKQQLFVGDLLQPKVFMFSPDGKMEKVIGGKGKGPGEFLSIGGLWIFEDTLFVLVRVGLRITAFAPPEYDVSFTIDLNLINGKLPTPAGDASLALGIGLNGLWKTSRGFFITYGSPYSPANLQKAHELEMHLVNKDGKVVTTTPLFKLQDKEMFVIRKGKSFMVGVMPLGVVPIIQFYNGKFYWLNNNNTSINVTDGNGNLVRRIPLPLLQKVKVHHSVLEEMFSLYGYSRKYSLLDFKRQGVTFPEYFPYIVNFIVDGDLRIWYATYTEKGRQYSWRIVDEDGKLIKQFILPRTIVFIYSKGEYVYALQMTEEGIAKILKLEGNF